MPISITVGLLDGGTIFTINGKAITEDSLTWVDGTYMVLIWLFCCVISWGFWNRMSWIRYAIVSVYVLAFLYVLIFNSNSIGLFNALAGGALSYWYLFKKTNVVEYFEYNYNQVLNKDVGNINT